MSHWYSKDGKPQHFIEGKTGMRDSTLRDARKFGWYPSVTEIINTLDKPALVQWKVKQVLTASLTLPWLPDEGVDAYYSRVMKDAFKESTDARDRGSEIHNDIERIWKGQEALEHDEIARAAVHAILGYTNDDDDTFIPEATVVGAGYGGMIDLHNDDFLIDYKTKEIKESDWDKYCIYMGDQQADNPKGAKPPKLAYPEMCMQLSAYDKALGGQPRRLINVFVDRNIAGRVIIHEWNENMYDRFELLVKYWQLAKNYFPAA